MNTLFNYFGGGQTQGNAASATLRVAFSFFLSPFLRPTGIEFLPKDICATDWYCRVVCVGTVGISLEHRLPAAQQGPGRQEDLASEQRLRDDAHITVPGTVPVPGTGIH
jgi:hypothetical protein